MPQYYDRYINLVSDVELSQALDESIAQLNNLDIAKLTQLENRPYAEGKWTVQELLQHLIDWERIFCYRGLLFARRVGDPPQGLEENDMADNSRANERTVADIVEELKVVRAGTKYLFTGFDEDTLKILGKANTTDITVGAVAFASLGHQIHHLGILRDRYMPLLND